MCDLEEGSWAFCARVKSHPPKKSHLETSIWCLRNNKNNKNCAIAQTRFSFTVQCNRIFSLSYYHGHTANVLRVSFLPPATPPQFALKPAAPHGLLLRPYPSILSLFVPWARCGPSLCSDLTRLPQRAGPHVHAAALVLTRRSGPFPGSCDWGRMWFSATVELRSPVPHRPSAGGCLQLAEATFFATWLHL